MPTVASLLVELSLNTAKFSSGIDKANQSLKGMKQSLNLIKFDSLINLGERAKNLVEAMYHAGRSIASMTSDIERNAKVLGLSTTTYQEWMFAAKMADVETQEIATGFKLLSRNMSDAIKGTGDAKIAFDAMGISVRDASTGGLKPLDTIMREVADKFSGWVDGPQKIAYALAIFGRSGEALIPMLNQGSAGLDRYQKRAKELGVILGTDVVKSLSESDMKFKEFELTMKVFTTQTLAPLIAHFTNLLEMLLKVRQKFAEPLPENSFLKDMLNSILAAEIAAKRGISFLEAYKVVLEKVRAKEEPEFAVSHGPGYVRPTGAKPPPLIDVDKEKQAYLKLQEEIAHITNNLALQIQVSKELEIAEISRLEKESIATKRIKEGVHNLYEEKRHLLEVEKEFAPILAQMEDEKKIYDLRQKSTEEANKAYTENLKLNLEMANQRGYWKDINDAIDKMTESAVWDLWHEFWKDPSKYSEETMRIMEATIRKTAEMQKVLQPTLPMGGYLSPEGQEALNAQYAGIGGEYPMGGLPASALAQNAYQEGKALRDLQSQYAELIDDKDMSKLLTLQEAEAYITLQKATGAWGEDAAAMYEKIINEQIRQSSTTYQFMQGLGRTMTDSIISNLESVRKGTESFADAMKNIFENMVDDIISQMMRIALNQALMGNTQGTSITEGLLGALGGIFKSIIPAQSGYEGWVSKPTPFLVGEGGQREFVSIIPETKMKSKDVISKNKEQLEVEKSILDKTKSEVEKLTTNITKNLIETFIKQEEGKAMSSLMPGLNLKQPTRLQEGGQFWANGPTPLLVGEGNQREFVSVTPESKMGKRKETPAVINNYNTYIEATDIDSFEKKVGPIATKVYFQNRKGGLLRQ